MPTAKQNKTRSRYLTDPHLVEQRARDAAERELRPVLTVNLAPGHSNEIFMLEQGQWMPYFGGSRSGYIDSKSATLVIREKHPNGQRDIAYNLTEPQVWDWLAKLINDSTRRARAVVDGKEPKFDIVKDL